MKLIVGLMAVLMISPAVAQQRQRAPVATPAPVSGWSRPIAEFPAAFNETAERLRLPLRATDAGCSDIQIPGPGRMCEYRIGRLIAFVSAKEDRSTLEGITVYLEGLGQDGGAEELRSAFTVLAQLFEPGAPQARRAAATSEIQSQMIVIPAFSREAKLGETQFHLVVLRQVRSILRVRRAPPA